MLVAAVAAVDHRDLRILSGEPRRAVAWMPDNDDVGVIGNDPDCVGEAFTFGGGTDRRVSAGNIGAAEPQHRALERESGACRGLVEKACEDASGGEVGATSDPIGDVTIGEFLQKPLGDLEDRLDLLIAEVV